MSKNYGKKCIIWNVEQAEPVNVVSCHNDVIQSISWNRDGSLFCTSCKDKTLRVIDPRLGDCVVETNNAHGTPRPIKAQMLGDMNKILTTGFSINGTRELAVWDIKNMKTRLNRIDIDSSNGILLPYYDHDSKVIYIAGKGDGNIRYYEIVDDSQYCHYLNNYGSHSPQRGLGMMPKRGCDASKCEIMRFYKLHAAKNYVEPLSMVVPRKANIFHEDIFPSTASAIPSLSSDEWISGQNRDPILISMKDNQVVNDPPYIPHKASLPQDGALNQTPVITTYRALTSQNQKSEPPKIPASIKNIKQLSTSEDVIVLKPTSQTITEEVEEKIENKEETSQDSNTDTDRAFVNSKIAAFENKGTNNNSMDVVTSPRKRLERRSWSTNPENPPDVIANGIKASTENSSEPLSLSNAAQFFKHKEIEIIDIRRSEKAKVSESSKKDKNLSVQSSTGGKLILGELNEEKSGPNNHKIHVKKTWSPINPSANHSWDDIGKAPNTDPELRKAYFQQVKEINALKEQLSLKDKRIRQLEDEVNTLRKPAQGESDC
ncbi:hypothetical protein ACF0H5_024504 [Mactra antiquata]